MRKQNLMVMAAGLLMATWTLAGSLDPTNAPGPTMHTLEEIYQKQVDTYQKVNNLVVYTNVTAAVPKSGETNSYQAGDDGSYQKGVTLPNPRFTVQTDTNCVLDNLTGLIWARNANLAGGGMTWSNAIVYCEDLDYGGQTDWRLPNDRELKSLTHSGYYNVALCNTAGTGQWTENDPFAGVQSYYYWTSTSIVPAPDHAWFVSMDYGYTIGDDKIYTYYVWPVRGGQ